MHTGAELLTDRQPQRLTALFAGDTHVQVGASWTIHQRMINAYRDPGRAATGLGITVADMFGQTPVARHYHERSHEV